jgi:hypothetical protein
MKKLLVLAALLIAVPAVADDIARLPDVTIEGVVNPGENEFLNGTILIATITADGVFTDHSADYQAAFAANGMTADIVFDPGVYGWPDVGGYKMIVVLGNDCWWSGYWGAADEAILDAYPGPIVIVGQDYAYQYGPSAWLLARFDIVNIIQDINFGTAADMVLDGRPGGPFEGKDYPQAPCCWSANCWFTDDVTPGTYMTTDWQDLDGFSGHGGAAVDDGIFSTNAFECWTAMMEYTVADFIAWLKGETPVEESSWSKVKDFYR